MISVCHEQTPAAYDPAGGSGSAAAGYSSNPYGGGGAAAASQYPPQHHQRTPMSFAHPNAQQNTNSFRLMDVMSSMPENVSELGSVACKGDALSDHSPASSAATRTIRFVRERVMPLLTDE
jgi:hypothetical protein